MRLQDHIDFTTLQWVKPELDETLALARQALESYVDNPGEREAMRSCADNLHQVQGTLRMVELYGAAMVAEEMETLAISLLEDHVRNREDAYAALMRGLMQLPDYLERLSGGHRDVPVVLLPLLNELRASREQEALTEAALFTPNLDAQLPAQAPPPANVADAAQNKAEIGELRLRFQQQMLAWFRGQGAQHQLAAMRKTLTAITARCTTTPGRRLWWIAAGVLEGLDHGVLKNHAGEVRQLIGRVDRSIRQLIEQGENSLQGGDADDLARKLLYIVAQCKQRSPQMTQLAQTYNLDGLVPDDTELEHARGSMAGHNRALLDSVARALKDDLLRVKESLDLFLRQADADPAQLGAQAEVLERVGDTLGMLALNVPRRVINEQRRVLEEVANRMRSPDEESLLDVAGALLYVEASLDDHIESLGAENAPAEEQGPAMLPRSEARHILATLMNEAVGNTGKVKNGIVAFVESGWQHEQLNGMPALMDEVAGAMRMLSSPRPAQIAEGVGRFIGNELCVDQRVPSSVQMDQLADALAALEYYLEAAREHRGGLEHILDVAEHSLGGLGYWPPPLAKAMPEPEEEAHAELHAPAPTLNEPVSLAHGEDVSGLFIGHAETPAPLVHDVTGLHLVETESRTYAPAADEGADWIEIEEEVEEQVASADPLAAGAGFQASTEGIDDDIREIFLEEMQEEINNLRQAQEAWVADAAQLTALTPIRRSFHTLKGSGRLVGASVLGEFAWRVENMLNRVLDGTVPPHEGVQVLVGHAIDALPQLLAMLRDGQLPTAPLSAIMQAADKLAAGEQASMEQFASTGDVQTVRRVVRRRVPRTDAAIDAIPAATHTDHSVAAQQPVEVAEPAAFFAPIHEPVLPPVDPVLLEILRSEVAQYLQIIRNAANFADGELPVEDGLLRAVHTLHGAIAMVEIPLLMHLLSPLESLLKRLRAAGQPLSTEGVRLLRQSADVVDEVMAQFDTPYPQLPDAAALIERLEQLRDHQPEPQMAHVVFEPHQLEAEAAAPDAHEAQHIEFETPLAPSQQAPAEHDAETQFDAPLSHDDDEAELLAALSAHEPEQTIESFEHAAPETTEPLSQHEPETSAEEEEFAALLASLDALEPEEHATALTHEADVAPVELHADVQHLAANELLDATPATEAEAADEESKLADEAPQVEHVAEEATEQELTPEPEPEHVEAEAEHVAEEPVHVAEEPAHVAEEPVHAAEEPAVEAEPVHVAEEAVPAEELLIFSHIDPDLLEIFSEEAREILDDADGVLAKWHAEPADVSHMNGLLRALHTLKGGARIAGVTPVGDLSHAIESLLERSHNIDPQQTAPLIGTLEVAFDQMHGLVQRVSQGKGIAYPHAMIELLQKGTEEPAAASAEAPAEQHIHVPAPQPLPMVELPSLLPAEELQTEEVGRTAQEQIRVRADLLDSLVNNAGEVAIYRSRLEQQVSAYRFNLVELEQTVSRLRGQLRMLEIETEAQIIARFQREHREAGIGVFDPLELDRFSQLQQYSRALAESVSDLVSIQNMLDELTRQAETLLIQQSRVSSELQEGLLRTRMLPFDTMVPNLRRTLRQAAQEETKSAQLYVEGAHGEMDRNLLDRIKAPFEHMLRNAVAHGIETPDERRKAGKPEEGAVRIRVAREATEVVVRVSDDGRGLDREAIRKRAIERGLVRHETRLSDDQLLALITQTGFSTASTVTQLAGRGVGMDVVANEIKQLGGSLAIESTQGVGTTFVLRLPFTLAVTQAILVRIGESTFAIPMTSVQGVARITPDELAQRMAEDNPQFEYNGEEFGIHDLSELLGLVSGHVGDEEQLPLLLTRSGDLRAAIRIDAVIGSREIVVKSVGPQVSSVPGILGATIMGDGSVLVILDLAPLVRHGLSRREQRLAEGASYASVAPVVEDVRTRPLVMVVDDSITMRKVTGRVLERHEYEVETAKDGLDALEKLHERVPDLMLLDIEMPRMDGYELAIQMKADPRFRGVPIIMITSRTGEKHRQRAFDLGVERYLGKPYQEAELLAQISEVLEQHAREPVND
ncbi:Hpt domain-containing protein [Dyella acidiphila]|uniref:histidine kinase n=1 Tax=Dyella acidiphila TaxID=2775866 RepID=A0ABR9G944_9GAMM|nr:Hpt domain-containing protein [Dyella acidiphila]MBE1160564.1 Hpt domain-containing protein [Dyella acidiphila]